MKTFSIIVKADTFTTDYPHIIDTPFYISSQGKVFPDSQWTDFTYPILNDWAYALLRHRDKNESKFSLHFMDGPFRLDVTKDKDMKLTIQCVNFRKEETTELTINCNYVDFLLALYQAIKKTSEIMFNNNIHQGKFESVYKQLNLISKELETVIGSYSSTACRMCYPTSLR